LGEPGVEVVLESVGVGEVDAVRLVGVFCDVGEVQTEGLAEAAELDFARVGEAEGEGLLGDGLVEYTSVLKIGEMKGKPA
jgi:hypothetical protein